MVHATDGTLRRMEDEPQAVPMADRRHVAVCRRRLAQVSADAQFTHTLLAHPMSAPDTTGAFLRLQQRLLAGETSPPPTIQERISSMIARRGATLVKPFAGIAAGVSLVAAIALTPAGAWAGNFLSVFEPTQVTAVPIDPADLKSLPDLAKYGSIHAPASPVIQHFQSSAAAAAAAGLPALAAKSLPAGVPNTPSFEVIPGATGSFTFSAAKAQANAAAQGKSLPAMPANLDGATLQVSTGTALVVLYADQSKVKMAVGAAAAQDGSRTASASQEAAIAARALGPSLVIAEMKAPTVTTTGNGVTAAQLEAYLLAQPGISPSLAAAIRAMGDPTSTLPIPVPINKAVSQNVTLADGAHAVVIGDSTGLVGGIIWVKGAIVYGVGGSLTQSQLINLANGLAS